ncbi:MAG: tetratricopeptide repeat protein [Armatimonadetes bacterium]|nr:tetratricopeptide repeat protein [Armatimonadota bacterium]
MPEVQAEALIQQVSTLANDLRAEAERLIKEEGADKAIERLRAEATADEKVAFRRLNLAAVVAALGGDEQTARAILANVSAAADEEIPLALARHKLLIDGGHNTAREASNTNMTWQGRQADSLEGQLKRRWVILAGLQRLAPDSLDVAISLGNMGSVYHDRGDLEAALSYCQRALAIRERLAPDSLDVAISLNNIGAIHEDRGDLDAALDYYRRSLAILERLAPDSLKVAISLNNIGSAHHNRGDLEAALGCYQRSLAIMEHLAPESLEWAAGLGNLGMICQARGDLDRALDYCQRSLAIEERLAPDSLKVATSLSNIGLIYSDRGDLDAAQEYYQRALAIRGRLAPDSLDVANSLKNIGTILFDPGDLDAVQEYYQRSLAIEERLAPDSLKVATSLSSIGTIFFDRGDLDAAQDHYQRALAIRERLAPDSLDVATSLDNIGTVHRDRGDLDAALESFHRSLAIWERLAPDSDGMAGALRHIGQVYRTRGESAAALEHYRRAVATIECARGKSGSQEEARAMFLAQHTDMYGALLTALLADGQVEEAADVAERMRGRSLLEMTAERRLGAAGSPELVTKQRMLDVRRDRLYSELQGAGRTAPDEKRTEEITTELQRVRLDQETLEREIRQSDPRYAALEYPEPMTVAQLGEALDPGTVVLLHVVGEQGAQLFVFGPGLETKAHEVKVTSTDLEQKVRLLLNLFAQKQDAGAVAQSLSELLLKPAADEIGKAKRLLILPDGPLWQLPFHALPMGKGTYLCDRVPVHYAPSGTVFVEGRTFREGSRKGKQLLAYGAPDYSGWAARAEGPAPLLPVRSGVFEAVRSGPEGTRFAQLPESGVEANAVGKLFAGESDVREGAAATETSVQSEGPGKRVLHVACHGLLDPASPMDSALVLSIPREPAEGNDGFLKAWEVFGLDLAGCDLVTLSACETAKGKTLSGEGVVGLTRAFMYAGAASVLCTQWKVADDSTAALMYCFYRHYRAGESKDVALQQAMRELRTGRMAKGGSLKLPAKLGPWKPAWSDPYYWAPFILMGEYLQT